MGRKGSWFSSVKKVFISDSKKDQKHHHYHHHKSKLACFGHHHHNEDPEKASEGAAITFVPSLPPRRDIQPKTEAEHEQNKQAFSLVLATAVAAGAALASAQAAADVARLANASRYPGKTNEEIAAIKIQQVFRGYLARKSLRALRGLARLKALVQGQSVQRQSATTLQCMQTLSKLQSQVRARKIRMSEDNQSLHRQMQQKRDKELEKSQPAQPVGEKWDDSSKSKEQIEAKLLNRQVATMRREKALAYAVTHQQTWKNSSKSSNATFMDPNYPHWGWNWLERWMAARPWEGQNTIYHNNEHSSAKSAASHTMSVGEITKLYSLRDQNQDVKNSPASQKASHPRSHNNSPSTQPSRTLPLTSAGRKTNKASSPKGSSWGGDGDSKSMFNKNSESNRRHSISVSPVRNDDESLTSSPAFPSHTTSSTKVAKARPKVPSPFGVDRNGTTEKGASVSAKKRLSFPAPPSSSRRHSVPTKMGMVSNKNVAPNPVEKEKVKVKNGGSR